jgi:hypothetical protein
LLDEFELLVLDEFELLFDDELLELFELVLFELFDDVLFELFDDVLFELFDDVLFELLELVRPEGAGAGAGTGAGAGGGVVGGCVVGATVVGAGVVVVGATVVVVGGTVVVVDVLVGTSVIGGGVSPRSSSSARIVPVANAARPSPPIAPARYTQLVCRVRLIVHLRFGPTVDSIGRGRCSTQCGDVDEPPVGER